MIILLCGVFFVSGTSALIFETLWFRQAGLAFGNSVWTSSLILSGFMGGLALGNAVAARYGNRFRSPVLVYAMAEIAIALTGIGLVYLLPVLGTALAPLLRPLLNQPWILNPVRFTISFILLLIPSTAMGVTLPLLTMALRAYDPNFGSVLGKLYGWNTLGAAIGAVAGETYLIGAYGVKGTALLACALNLCAAVVAAWVSIHARTRNPQVVRDDKDGTGVQERKLWLFAVFLSGFCLLALEVVWFRFLLLFVMGHSTAFALMLGIILAGIGLGGLVASQWLKISPDAHLFASPIAFLSGLLCVLSYATFPVVLKPFAADQIRNALGILSIGVPLMFPVSLFSGVFFTLVGAGLNNGPASETRTTGDLTLANTIGAALGSLIGGFVLLPVLGIEKSLFFIAMLFGGLGIVLFLKMATSRRIVAICAIAFLLSAALFPFGSMRGSYLQIPVMRHLQIDPDAKIVAVREGLTETIIYLKRQMLGRPLSYRLLTNSFSMSSTSFAPRRYMKLFVYWPMAVHPQLKHALLIGYGIGNTAKAAVDSKGLDTIDVVDISRDLLEMNNIVYADKAEQPLQDSRVRVHIEDGRYFLQTTVQRFDLITGEPPPLGLAGVVSLYTREYFQLLFDRLAEGGIVTYRMPLRELTDVSAKALLRAFCDVFKDCSLWNGMSDILMLVGTRNASGPIQENQFTRQWNDPVVGSEMRRLGFERPEQLGALFIGDADYLKELIANSQPLVDNYPKLIEAPYSSQEGVDRILQSITDTDAARERFSASPLIKRLWPERLATESLPYFEFQGIINTYFYGDKLQHPSDMEIVHRLLTRSTLSAPILWYLDSDGDIQQIIANTTSKELAQPEIQFHLGIRFISERNYAAAVEPLSHAEHLPQLRAHAFLLHKYALCMSIETDKARCLQ